MGNDDKAELVMFGNKMQDGGKRAGLEVGNKRMNSKGIKKVFFCLVL